MLQKKPANFHLACSRCSDDCIQSDAGNINYTLNIFSIFIYEQRLLLFGLFYRQT